MVFIRWIESIFRDKIDTFAADTSMESLYAVIPSDVAWNNLLVSKPMKTILTARHSCHLPSSPAIWADLCQAACQLWIQLDDDGLIEHLPTVYPAICLLIKANYYFQTFPLEAQRLLFDEEPYTNLLRSVAACSFCPYSFVKRLLETQAHQLMLADYAGRKTPLHVLCDNEDVHHDANRQPLIALFVESCAVVASEMDNEGLYPLHRACRASYVWSTGIKELVNAAPQILPFEYRGQTPFIMAALAHALKKDRENLRQAISHFPNQRDTAQYETEVTETLYEMLRLDPKVVKDLQIGDVVGYPSKPHA
ncbi:hypothetical protein MHU86_17947 [Fragilaria crotonensis]|nr:hypothetical protein MHU86_17947 [Fragilaria crotonensis]